MPKAGVPYRLDIKSMLFAACASIEKISGGLNPRLLRISQKDTGLPVSPEICRRVQIMSLVSKETSKLITYNVMSAAL